MGREDDLFGVERARADIAVDDAEGAEGKDGPAGISDDVSLGVGQGVESACERPPTSPPRLSVRRCEIPELVCRLVETPFPASRGPPGPSIGPGGRLDTYLSASPPRFAWAGRRFRSR